MGVRGRVDPCRWKRPWTRCWRWSRARRPS